MELARQRGGALKTALALTCAVLLVEAAGGFWAHSLALLSDAGHVLTDVFALALAWFALEQAKRPSDLRRSYGYHRVSVLAALLNGVILILIVLGIVAEAIRRLAQPQPVQGGIVIAAALVAIAINSFVLLTLREHRRNLNLRAAVLHVAGDAAASVAVVIGGAIILITGWVYIDPLLSIAIAVLIALGAVSIVRETVNLLLEGTPQEIDVDAVSDEIAQTNLITDVHDLHVWALSSDEMALSCHVVVGEECPLGDAEHAVRDLEGRLCDRFGIGHTTIQVESCHPCGEIHHGVGEHNHPHDHVLFKSSGPLKRPHAAGSSAPQQ